VAIGDGDGSMARLMDLVAQAEPDEEESRGRGRGRFGFDVHQRHDLAAEGRDAELFAIFTAYVTANIEMADGTERGTFLRCARRFTISPGPRR